MKKVLAIVLGVLLLVVCCVFIGFGLSKRNTFNLIIETDTDIQYRVGDSYKKVITETYKKGLLKLASTTGSKEPVFYKVNSNDKVKEVTSSRYVLRKDVEFRTTDDNSYSKNEIRVSMHLESDNSTELNNSLRVMLVINGRYFIFAPGEKPNKSYKGVAGVENGKAIYNSENETISTLDKTYVISNYSMLQEFEMSIYIWYEAKDGSIAKYNGSGKHTNSLTITLY